MECERNTFTRVNAYFSSAVVLHQAIYDLPRRTPRAGLRRDVARIAGGELLDARAIAGPEVAGEVALGPRRHVLEQLADARAIRCEIAHVEVRARAVAEDAAAERAQSAHTILFFGSLAIIPWKLIWKFGLYTIPLVYFFVLPERKTAFRKYRLFQLAIICHLLVLSVFVLQQQFISGRYYGPLLIFAVPFVAIGLNHWLSIRPKWQWPIVVVGIALAMNNVVSLKAGNQHFSEAGHWLSSQIKDGPRIYLESARAAHYAGWKFSIRTGLPDRAKLLEEIKRNDFDVVVLETSRKEPSLADWISLAGLQEIRRFTDDDGDAVIVYVPLGQPFPPAQPSTTPSKREKTTSAE